MISRRHTLHAVVALTMTAMLLFFAAPSTAQPEGTTLWAFWIATGDDGVTGQAWQFDLRYSTTPVGASIATWWNYATHVAGVPQPSLSGVPDSVLVTGLSPGTIYYFVLRVADEALNWSSYSNASSAQTAGTPGSPPSSTPPPEGGEDASDLRAYPNPAPGGSIRFELRVGGTEPRPVRIRVFDLNGHVVAEVADTTYPSGLTSITWDRLASSGNPVAPGYYEVIGTVGSSRVRERLLLLP